MKICENCGTQDWTVMKSKTFPPGFEPTINKNCNCAFLCRDCRSAGVDALYALDE